MEERGEEECRRAQRSRRGCRGPCGCQRRPRRVCARTRGGVVLRFIPVAAYRALRMSFYFNASMVSGEAVLRFPYDERLRQLLRAIPGRRWDPVVRAWCVPLDPEGAEALARLLAGLPGEPQVSDALARTLARRRRRRRADECVLDLARPDGEWWLSFATDAAPELVAALLEHPDGYSLPAIGRALIPLDERAAQLVAELEGEGARLRLTEIARRGVQSLRERDRGEGLGRRRERDGGEDLGSRREPRVPGVEHDVELRRDRRGGHWILLAAAHAPLARVLAGRAGLRAAEGPAGTFALAAVEPDAAQIGELIEQLEPASVEPGVRDWLVRATEWRGTIEGAGSREAPVSLLLGDVARLPPALREHATSAPGGATVPLTQEHWRLMEGQLRGWTSPAAKRCIAALRDGRPVPPAVLELSPLHDDPTFVLAPGHEPAQLDAFAALGGALPGKPRRGARDEQSRLPAIRADPFCVPELDAFLAVHGAWVAPEALAVLQEIREQHARAAGLVELSAATDAPLRVPGLGGG